MPQDPNSPRAADVIIIGAGLIGCAIAYRLAQSHLKVIVLERGEPGGEASQAAAGMLAPQGETVEPGPFFELCAASRNLYPNFLAEIEQLTGQLVDYHREGTLLVAIDEEESKRLEKIYQAQTRANLEIECLAAKAVLDRAPGLSPRIQCGLFISGDHWVDNERLMYALVNACQRLGVSFHAGNTVSGLNVRNGRVESVEAGPVSSGARSAYSAGHFVLAAGCWSRDLVAPLGIDLPMKPCRGQMIEFESDVALTQTMLTVRAGHHYLVPRPPGRILAGTTVEYAGFNKAVTGEGLRSILEGAARFAPLITNLRFRRAWAGLRPDTSDHLPILGYGELENLIFATGHFRNGILLAPVSAQLISELLVTGTTSHSIDVYSPWRFRRPETAAR